MLDNNPPGYDTLLHPRDEEEDGNLEPCVCGDPAWDFSGRADQPRCTRCDTGPGEVTFRRSTEHTARQTHAGAYSAINPGDRYRRVVAGGFFPGGPRFLTVAKYLLERGN